MIFSAALSRLRISIICAVTTLLIITSAVPGPAQATPAKPTGDPRIGSLIDILGKTRTPMQAALSPDSTTVAWSVRTPQGAQIRLTDVANPTPASDRTITPPSATGACGSAQPVWSPAGDSLAFVSTCTAETDKPQQTQIFVWSRKTGQSRQLTHLTGSIENLAWSPDGRAIAFLFVENATRSAGALAAMKPWSGVVGEDGVEVQGVAVLTVATSKVVQVTPSTLHVYEFDWAPDSRRIAYVAANPPGENNWWVAQLYTQTIISAGASKSSSTDPHSILDTTKIPGPLHGLQIAVPKWSPDGKRIAFIGGIMSDQGSTGGDIYSISSAGGTPSNITPDKSVSAAWIDWSGPNAIRYVAHRGGGYIVSVYNVESLTPLPESGEAYQQSLWAGNDVLSVSKSGSYAFVTSSYAHPPEVFVSRKSAHGPNGGLVQISHLNSDLKPTWGKAESIEWENGGFKIQGWLLYPADYDPAKKYPLIVNVHGGPSAAITPHWPGVGLGSVPYFSALGYFVFMPNPRGSYGQGEKFTQANVKDFGYGDLSDILSGMDVLEKRFPIDKNREGLTGWSYGGFMTMFGVTQTPRFRAAVAGAGISDWKSYYGENSIDQWMVPFFGATVYDDPAVYAKSSAIEYIKNVKTPTLVVVGDRDGECPAPQSFEFWHALRAQGVKTQLVIYPNEGHRFADPTHQRDVLERALNWFETQMPASRD
jgi:dipeptidyl aminopeptidase/acylaminoacyl peptidase